jgi:RNA polymerase sigma factor (sigma-70 family)|tara:strand:+ start:282 stop:1991 length:1710 start_codon:yes stop_codon:yes gene_type:complete
MEMTNFSESEILPVAVKVIKNSPSGIDTKDLIKKLRTELKPDGEDTIVLINRMDDKFSQKVRNLRSHKTLEKKNLAIFKDDKYFITEKGSDYLNQTKSLLQNVIKLVEGRKFEIKKEINFDSIVEKFLSTLTPKEESVIKMRFGIGYNSPKTLQEIGSHYAVTRERIRQIEAKALRKMKHPARYRIIRPSLIKLEEILNKTIFMSEKEFLKKINANGIKTKFSISILRIFLRIFQFTKTEDRIHFIKGKLYVIESFFYKNSFLKLINSHFRDSTQKKGIIDYKLLHREVRRKNFLVSKKSISDILNNKNGFLIGEDYFVPSAKQERNRLLGAIHSTLSVTPRIDIEELADCLRSFRRTDNYSPPLETLKVICKKIGYEVSENFILNKNYSDNNSYLVGVRKKLFKMFLKNGRVMSYEQILDQHKNFDLNINSVNVMIYENLFTQPRKMIFVLAGSEVSEEDLNVLESNRKKLIKELSKNIKFFHDKNDGNIIISFPKKISKGFIWLSPDYMNLIPEGDYEININNQNYKLGIFKSRLWLRGADINSEKNEQEISIKLDVIKKKAYLLNG